MAVYNIILPAIDENETARYAGLGSQQGFPSQLIKEACLEAKLLSAPQAAWEIYHYNSAQHTIDSTNHFQFEGAAIVSHLSGCRKVAILAVTIGSELETKAAQLFSSGSYTAGLLLDAAGSAAVEAAADKVNELIAASAEKEGLSAIMRFSPGYGDWRIEAQPEILKLAGGADIGMETAPSCMLIPRKSITAVIGLKEAGEILRSPEQCQSSTCLNCTQKNCFARKEHTS